MDPTTLVTFLFRAPPEARTVELLGSWDNFRQPYRMHNDLRRGKGFWSGCFKFYNIVFDGDKSHWTKPRTGGLKQGGTYWYYYRLDDDIEAYDDSREYTTGCPLLPGQTLNVIEVPMEVGGPCRSRSASLDVMGTLTSLPTTHTLDPGDKFAALDPPPISRVHGRCKSDLELNGRLENTADSGLGSSGLPTARTQSEQAEMQRRAELPFGRFYESSSYVDDRNSSYSRRSGYSHASSFAHSSVIDMCGVEPSMVDGGGPESFSSQVIPRSSSPSRADAPISSGEFEPQFESATARNGNEFDRFEFGWPSIDAIPNTVAPREIDRDFSTNYLPPSRADISPHGSPRVTSHSAQEWLLRSSSSFTSPTPNHRAENSCSTIHAPPHTSSERTAAEQEDPGSSPHHEPDSHGSSSDAEADSSDLWSPTFSAATVSSTGGVNTPHRLSNTHSGCSSYPHGDSIESVAERLRSLGSLDDYDGGVELPSPLLETGERSVAHYALPSDEAVPSPRSFGKLSSGHASLADGIPTVIVRETRDTQESSFADSILRELGLS